VAVHDNHVDINSVDYDDVCCAIGYDDDDAGDVNIVMGMVVLPIFGMVLVAMVMSVTMRILTTMRMLLLMT